MTVSEQKIGQVIAKPTKSFFVRMLTRDIELQDALLDLLDNCVDGIVRSLEKGAATEKPYDGYFARMIMCSDHFVIEDNCGGIPIDVAKKYAFAIGKPEGAAELDSSATVGMYGIGMKRAIFKLGSEAIVESNHDTGFQVEFSPQWMETDDWSDLPMYAQSASNLNGGTRIEVHTLHDEAKAAFGNAVWIDEFRKTVSRHYALIVEKGFAVYIGSPEEILEGVNPIEPERFRFLETKEEGGHQLAPYIYIGKIGEVDVEIYAGMYRELLNSEDADSEEETRGSSDDAGWTIACNDRVVVWKDRGRLTGWGEASVPNYHGQFIAISGIVLLSSDDPTILPLTTTKRGIDAASDVYSEAKDIMRDITKALTSFTNKWKRFPSDLEAMYAGATYSELRSLRASAVARATSSSRKHLGLKKFEPSYPVPVQEKTSARVSFVALKADISYLSTQFFGGENAKPGDVGEAAFEDVLSRFKNGVSA